MANPSREILDRIARRTGRWTVGKSPRAARPGPATRLREEPRFTTAPRGKRPQPSGRGSAIQGGRFTEQAEFAAASSIVRARRRP